MIRFKTHPIIAMICLLLLLLCTSNLAMAATYTYDDLNRLISVTYENGQKVIFTYDAGGNLLSISMVDTAAPAVNSTDPADGAIGISVSRAIYATFNEAVVEGANFKDITIKNTIDNTVVGYTYSINGSVLTLCPVANLQQSVTYAVYIPAAAVQDTAGNAFAGGYSFSFTTQAPGNTIPGEVGNLTVTPQVGAGRFKLSFIAPADQNLQGVAVFEAVYGSTVWRQVYFEQNQPVLLCQPGQAVDTMIDSSYTLGGGNLQFKVVAVDQSGNQSKGVVADNGGRGYPALVYWQLKAGPEGWTTFSVPVRLAGGQKIFGDIIDPAKAEIAYKFDAATQLWKQVTSDTIAPFEAIFVKLKEDTLAAIRPSTSLTVPPVKDLEKGWNLIGPTDSRDLASALYSIDGLWRVVVSPTVNPAGQAGVWAVTPGQSAKLAAHFGYWVYMNSPGRLIGFSGTPVSAGTYPR